MKKNFKKILSIINICIPILLFIILLFSKLGDNTFYLMVMSLIIGWIIPYFVLLITGLSLIDIKHPKLIFIFNILNVLMSVFLIILVVMLFEKKLIIFLIEYIIMMIISIINVIYIYKYIRKHPNKEIENIKRLKKENNGAIV